MPKKKKEIIIKTDLTFEEALRLAATHVPQGKQGQKTKHIKKDNLKPSKK